MMMMTSGSSIRGDSGSGSRSRMMWASIQKVEHVDRQLSVWRGDRNDTRERFLWSEVSWLSSMTDSDRPAVLSTSVVCDDADSEHFHPARHGVQAGQSRRGARPSDAIYHWPAWLCPRRGKGDFLSVWSSFDCWKL